MAVGAGEKHGRDPEPAEISRFIECVVALLNEECSIRPDLSLPFVGVGSGEGAAALWNAGVSTVVGNFLNYEHCTGSGRNGQPANITGKADVSGSVFLPSQNIPWL